jgi:hypothetical protein
MHQSTISNDYETLFNTFLFTNSIKFNNIQLNALNLKELTYMIESNKIDSKYIMRFIIYFYKYSVFNDLCILSKNTIITDPVIWNHINVDMFIKEIRNIVDNEIHNKSSLQNIVNKLTEYYSEKLLHNTDIIILNKDSEYYITDILIPKDIKQLIDNFIASNNMIDKCFDFLDCIFLDSTPYAESKKYIMDNLSHIIFMLIWHIILKIRDQSELTEISSIIDGMVAQINSNYLIPIMEMMHNLDEYIKFKEIYDQTFYPPVFIKKHTVDKFNKLFNKLYISTHTSVTDHIISYSEFEEEFFQIIREDVNYLEDMIMNGIYYAKNNGIDVVCNIYNHCISNLNILCLKNSFLMDYCPMNPSSPYFMQTLDPDIFNNYYKIIGAKTTNVIDCKRYNSYFNNFHNLMISNMDESKDKFIILINKKYINSVSVPINLDVLNEYISKYYDFYHNIVKKFESDD